ncbi:MAG: class I SAM-dependent methyltransferase [Candidatus Omnitrophica bacterium]|nr:class I SAM-dependent methyltransferase [Candidatus Omnitrophota bacterium]
MKLYIDINKDNRQAWLKKALAGIPAGFRILDAGAGRLDNKPLCSHLVYVSQDFCRYDGVGDGRGLPVSGWDTSRIDLVCDITAIPEPDATFDAILCSEVLEHVPDPLKVLDEFARLLKPEGKLILTAPFCSLVHFAPYHYCDGFSRYWYEYHLTRRGFQIEELTPNGDWFLYCRQELARLGGMSRRYKDWSWPLAYALGMLGMLYFKIRGRYARRADDVACFGWHCIAVKKKSLTGKV